LADGTITVTVDHDDAAGNSGQTSDTANKDALADVAITAIADINAANDNNYGFSGTCETDGTANVDYSVVDGDSTTLQGSVDCATGAWSVSGLDVTGLDDGSITVTIDHVDDAANPGQATDTVAKDT